MDVRLDHERVRAQQRNARGQLEIGERSAQSGQELVTLVALRPQARVDAGVRNVHVVLGHGQVYASRIELLRSDLSDDRLELAPEVAALREHPNSPRVIRVDERAALGR